MIFDRAAELGCPAAFELAETLLQFIHRMAHIKALVQIPQSRLAHMLAGVVRIFRHVRMNAWLWKWQSLSNHQHASHMHIGVPLIGHGTISIRRLPCLS